MGAQLHSLLVTETPESIFTPKTPVRDDMFATRRHEDLQARVEGALAEKGSQVVLYGPTGVGKTSLVRYLCRQGEVPYVRVECGPDFEATMRAALTEVVTEEVVERVRSVSGEAEAGFLSGLLNLKAKGSVGSNTRTAPIQRPLAVSVADAVEVAGIKVLFLDNFENLAGQEHESQTKLAMAQLLKSLADRSADSAGALKAVVAGIPEASEELVTADQATARRLTQIEVGRMPAEELDQILARGEEKLGIEFAGLCRNRILEFSDGFPYYTHLFALHCSRRVLRDGRVVVELDDFDAALDAILADCDLQLRTAYNDAIETSGEVRTRKTILEAMASRNDVAVTFMDIREEFLKLRPQYETVEKLSFLSGFMTDLKDEYQILADRGKTRSKNNLWRFANPLMRAYVRLRQHREEQGQQQLVGTSGEEIVSFNSDSAHERFPGDPGKNG
jgi:hypothetical protein